MERTFPLLEKLRDSVVVDCGHIIISGTSKKYRFGLNGSCSEGELLSFRTGINLVSSLRQLNKKATLNLYLSDLSGISGGNEERYAIYEKIKSGDKCQFIPKEYISLLEDAGFNEHDIEINLQSKGNERFKKIIKKTMSRISSEKSKNDYRKSLYSEYGALFLTNKAKEIFSITTPFLFNHLDENEYFNGNWWANDDVTIRDSWLKDLPFLKIKKNPVVNLYESGGKVLCPATYSGLLSHYNNDDDHIAVYSRRDDPFVGEKVIRGVIASNILDKDFSRNCLQVILSNYDEQELSIICKDTIKKTNEDFNDFLNKINQIQNSKGLVLL